MKLRKSCIFKNTIISVPENLSNRSVFFDIETTGLSWRTSHLYMIGCAYYDENDHSAHSDLNRPDSGECGEWILQQWFLEKPAEEKKLLELFSAFLQEHEWDTLVHYNGTTFDIPYLQNKYQFYKLSDPLCCLKTAADGTQTGPFRKSRDLYQEIRPYKKYLCADSLKQRDLEACFGLPRRDCFSGGELISVYQDYLRSGDEAFLDSLWLHNLEDVQNLLPVCAGVNAFQALFAGRFQIKSATFFSHTDNIRISLNPGNSAGKNAIGALTAVLELFCPLPAALRISGDYCTLRAEKNSAVLTVPVLNGELRHYFADYKNYYYLPEEDMAIHKSVGIFVDPAHRKKATPDTCFQRTAGTFLPQTSERFVPVFRTKRKDKVSWFQIKNLTDTTGELQMRDYLLDLLKTL